MAGVCAGRPPSRWHISLIAARVDGLGGDSGSILPSPTGVPPRRRPSHEKTRKYEGKVCEVRYDCFGEFDGFVLADCGESRRFRTRVHGIEEVVLRACREHLTLQILVDKDGEERIVRLAIRCAGID